MTNRRSSGDSVRETRKDRYADSGNSVPIRTSQRNVCHHGGAGEDRAGAGGEDFITTCTGLPTPRARRGGGAGRSKAHCRADSRATASHSPQTVTAEPAIDPIRLLRSRSAPKLGRVARRPCRDRRGGGPTLARSVQSPVLVPRDALDQTDLRFSCKPQKNRGAFMGAFGEWPNT